MHGSTKNKFDFRDIENVYRFLDKLPAFQFKGHSAVKMGLERIRSFCAAMGNPQDNIPCIHIAGTNGKGSLAALLALVYEQAGMQCGLYTSPHLLHLNERFRINQKPVDPDHLLHFFQLWKEELFTADLSYFELTTAFAFWWFAHSQVDIMILETGLGGRLDATNLVMPEVSVITSVSYDHQQILGQDLAQIAREKAGIIKKNRPVVIGNLPGPALEKIFARAQKLHAPVWNAAELNPEHHAPAGTFSFVDDGCKITVETDLKAPVHRWTIAMAWLSCRAARGLPAVTADEFSKALSGASRSGLLNARFERLTPHYPWYFDGAHNREAVSALIETLKQVQAESEPVIILSLMKDKAEKKMLQPFSVFKKNYYYSLDTERAADIAHVTPYLVNISDLPPQDEKITEFLSGLTGQLVVFTGSFYFYSVVRRWVSSVIRANART